MVDPQNIDLLLYLTVHVKHHYFLIYLVLQLIPKILYFQTILCVYSLKWVQSVLITEAGEIFFLRKRTSFPASLLTTVPLIAEPWRPNQLFTPSIQPPNMLLPLKYFPPCPLPPPLFLICLLLILRVYSSSQFKRLFLRDQVTSSHYYLTALYASPSSHLSQLKLSICASVCLIFLAPARL